MRQDNRRKKRKKTETTLVYVYIIETVLGCEGEGGVEKGIRTTYLTHYAAGVVRSSQPGQGLSIGKIVLHRNRNKWWLMNKIFLII